MGNIIYSEGLFIHQELADCKKVGVPKKNGASFEWELAKTIPK